MLYIRLFCVAKIDTCYTKSYFAILSCLVKYLLYEATQKALLKIIQKPAILFY
jgi:hypothetical protein